MSEPTKRNWDDIRRLLLCVESQGNPISFQRLLDELSYAPWVRNAFFWADSGHPIVTFGDKNGSAGNYVVGSLSYDGAELLDAMRNDEIWAKIKKFASENDISLTEGLILAVSKAISLQKMGFGDENSYQKPKNTESEAKNA